MTSTPYIPQSTPVHSPRIRHRGRTALVLCISIGTLFGTAAASELVIGRRALQSILATTLFNDRGRWYLAAGNCYTYLENPRIALAPGRLVMDAHLASRMGLDVGDSCAGTAFSSDVQLSGKFVGSGSHVTLQDIRIDKVKDDATRQALDLLQAAAGSTLPHAIDIDLLELLKPALVPQTDVKVSVTAVDILGVTTQAQSVTVRFEAKLLAE